MTIERTWIARQGDVLLMRVPSVVAEKLERAPKDARGIVLAEGETSGHHHQVFGRGAKLLRFRDTSAARVLIVGRTGAEVHVIGGGSGGVPRHLPISLAPGSYEIRLQRSWTAEDERSSQVQD